LIPANDYIKLTPDSSTLRILVLPQARPRDEDNDSIFGEKPKRTPVASPERPTEPLIIRDNHEAGVDDLPSVSHLPDPKEGKAPEPAMAMQK
jgi:hypothetical protein